MKWNTNLYDQQHDFVSKYGEGVVDLLDPKEGETILDLGCGTGDLTALIQQRGATVIGLDHSAEMLEAARAKYPALQFDRQSADDFRYPQPFDAVFSNATLHWVTRAEKAVQCVAQALKPGGRFVAEFGGKGNVAFLIEGLTNVLKKNGYTTAADQQVWYFPSLSTYTTLLEQNGFRVVLASHLDRPTLLKSEKGIRNWLEQFGQPYLQAVRPGEVEALLAEVEAEVKPTNFREGGWYADYVRLRVMAMKEPNALKP